MESNNKWRLTRWLERQAGRPLTLFDKILLWVLVIILAFLAYLSLDANKYPALVRVIAGEGKVGVNPTDEALDFGDLSRGTEAVRRVTINNNTPIPMFIIAFKTGGIRTLMKTDKNYFRLEPHSEAQINFTTYMPASAVVGDTYNGRVFLFKIPTI